MISCQGLIEYPGVVDYYRWSIIAGMKCGLDTCIVGSVICALLATVMLPLGCATPTQGPNLIDNSTGGQNHWDKAVAELSVAINMDPVFALAYTNRGFTYYYKGEYDQAISDYTKAIELDPRLALAYNNRGLVYGCKGEYDKAIADYTKAIELDPKYANAYHNRAFIYYNMGYYDKFQDDYKKGQELIRPKATPQ
jgi:tetratricopeptide (TPR) repeat protein